MRVFTLNAGRFQVSTSAKGVGLFLIWNGARTRVAGFSFSRSYRHKDGRRLYRPYLFASDADNESALRIRSANMPGAQFLYLDYIKAGV